MIRTFRTLKDRPEILRISVRTAEESRVCIHGKKEFLRGGRGSTEATLITRLIQRRQPCLLESQQR
jgi:hypothetical protein